MANGDDTAHEDVAGLAPDHEAQSLTRGMRIAASLIALLPTLLPGSTFFTDHAPPFFSEVALLTAGVSIVILLWSYQRAPQREQILQRALITLSVSLLLIITYGMLLQFLTVQPPQDFGGERCQIGFYMAEWSLTDAAKEELPNYESPDDLMLHFGVWGGAAPVYRVWKMWSVIAAGCLLIFVFIASFGFWAYGWAIVAKYLTTSKQP